MTSAAESLVNALVIEDTRHVFGIPGTQNLPILDVLRITPSIRFVLTRHEQAAGYMAYGYAQVARKPGIVTATEGPGATNLVTPIAAAHKADVPIIAISGSPDREMLERDASQDIDQQTIFAPITRWSSTVPGGAKTPEVMRKAFRLALGSRQGPVHLNVSRETLMEDAKWEPLSPHSYRATHIPACQDIEIDRAFELLKASAQPLILTGAEQMYEEAGAALIAMADLLGTPVVTNSDHLDAFPSVHPLSLGAIGRSGWAPALAAVKQADLLLVIGGRLDSGSTLFGYNIIPPAVQIVLNTKDASQVGNYFPVEHAAIGSVASFVKGLTARIDAAGLQKRWLDVEQVRTKAHEWRRSQQNGTESPVQVPFAANVLRDRLDQDAIVCLDAGNATKHVRTHWDTHCPYSFFATVDFGAVGSALPMAMGAKVAAPERQVVALAGDMGFACNMAEIETCVRENINVIIIVFNDNGLGNEKAFQDALYGGRYFAVDYCNPDFAEVARVFRAHGERVETPDEFGPALDRSLAAGKPALIDVKINPHTLAQVILDSV